MVAKGISVFWIIINQADLWCPLIIHFAGIELELLNEIQSAFQYKTANRNLVAKAKFFHIICDAIFMSLFGANPIERGLLGPISNYFGTIETNGCGMLYPHY